VTKGLQFKAFGRPLADLIKTLKYKFFIPNNSSASSTIKSSGSKSSSHSPFTVHGAYPIFKIPFLPP